MNAWSGVYRDKGLLVILYVRARSVEDHGDDVEKHFHRPAFPLVEEGKGRKLEIIRGTGAVLLGYAKDLEDARINSQTLPKIAFVTAPVDYTAGSGRNVKANEVDIVGRLFSVNMKMIDAYMGTGAICTITAANTKGTIVNEVASENLGTDRIPLLKIGHPWGVMIAKADLKEDGSEGIRCGYLERTARRIMEGNVYVRE